MPANTGNMVIGTGGYVRIGNGMSQGARFDLVEWFLSIKPTLKGMAHSGCGGGMARKCVLLDWAGGFSAPYFDKAGQPTSLLSALTIGGEITIEFTQNNGDVYKGQAVVADFSTRAVSGPEPIDPNVITVDVVVAMAGPLSVANGGPDTTQTINLNSGTVPMVNTRV